MVRVVRVQITRTPLAVWVPRQGGAGGWGVRGGDDEALLLWEARARYADQAGLLPEHVRIVAFWDASWSERDAS
jgi:hypothetical protein